MKMRYLSFGLFLFGLSFEASVFAQSQELYVSRTAWLRQSHLGGTARYTSLGGAMSALGNDPGAMLDNPASSAMYRVGEWRWSAGQQTDNQKVSSGLNQGAYVHVFDVGLGIRASVAGGYALESHQTSPWNLYGTGSVSWVDQWLANAQGQTPEELAAQANNTYQAYYEYIIDYDPSNGQWTPGAQGGPAATVESIKLQEKGGVTFLNGSMQTGNASFGITLERIWRSSDWNNKIIEEGFSNSGLVQRFSWTTTETSQWAAYRTKVGFLYRNDTPWRFSIAWRSMATGTRRDSITSLMVGESNLMDLVPIKVYSHRTDDWTSPWEANIGLAFVHDKFGLGTAQVHIQPDGWMQFRLGVEKRDGPWSYRAGYRYTSHTGKYDFSGEQTGSLGMGIRGKRWTIDGGWALTLREGRWNSLYVMDEWDTPLVGTKAVLTLGYRID